MSLAQTAQAKSWTNHHQLMTFLNQSWRDLSATPLTFHIFFRYFRLRWPWPKTLDSLELGAHHMDRAEVLHAPSYGIEFIWKILLNKTIRCKYAKLRCFDRNFIYLSHPDCHWISQVSHRILLSKMTSHLYESLQGSIATQILREQSDFACLRLQNRPLTSLFNECLICATPTAMVQNLGLTGIRSSSYGSSWSFTCTKLWHRIKLEKYSRTNNQVQFCHILIVRPKFYMCVPPWLALALSTDT